ncbi:putative quinol monooxygenase [Candidatus Pantoea multigeneris]|uniref:Antibiotic biosynthesis monooxygenase n=1 Tax=Candidatus Pantoea multigeneris TaxID=2608357 RepID=A0ABX0R4A4_9GAMM|nr:putative quinol monooxygenase [Pantoea multigeneris]NIF20241.1 antibiotic biosynthesis monooxygenase [Pantoea multigeneris]
MYGVITQIKAVQGQRNALIAILQENQQGMAGCHSYLISRDLADSDSLWIYEVWDSKAAHVSSLQLLAVQDAIARARPVIGGLGHRFETEPV